MAPKFFVGSGVPASGLGSVGDMYIDQATGNVYGPKTASGWGAISANIKGPAGPAGYAPQYIVAAGAPSAGIGNNGDMYINSSTSDVYGPKAAGAWGAVVCNIKGAPGPQGAPGVAYTPRGAWSAATTYAQGDEVTYSSALYISLQSGNLNNVPASAPTWWQLVGSGGSQTPWLSNIDAAGFGLTNVASIGIGGAPVAALLDVAGDIRGRSDLVFTKGTTPMIYTSDAFPLRFGAGSAEIMRITTTGFVGIRQTAPEAALHIIGTQLMDNGAAVTSRPPFTSTRVNGEVSACAGGAYSDAGFLRLSAGGGTSTGQKTFIDLSGYSANVDLENVIVFGTRSTEKMRITGGGNVGIGTAAPRDALHVITGNRSTPATATQIMIGEATNTGGYYFSLGYYTDGSNYRGVLQVTQGGAGATLCLNPQGGFVAVGAVAPAYRLDVTGDVNCTGAFRVNGVALSPGIAGINFQLNGAAVSTRPTINFVSGTLLARVTDDSANNKVAVTFDTPSDLRIKQDVRDLIGGLPVINRVRPVSFAYNGLCGFEAGKRASSIIAQELQSVLPEAVYAGRTRLRPDNPEEIDLLCFDPMALTAHVILAVQQLDRRLGKLEGKEATN